MGFEQLRVYQAAELLDGLVAEIIRSAKRGHAKDIDHLKRACGSIGYNIAEAVGSEQPGRKINFLEIARGSTDETRAVLRRLTRAEAIEESTPAVKRAAPLTSAIAKMLTAWIKSIE